jgi:putative DNA primase/helicase
MPDVLREKHAGRMLIETFGDFRAMISNSSAAVISSTAQNCDGLKIIHGNPNGKPDDWDESDFDPYVDHYDSQFDDAAGDGAEALPFSGAETLPCTYVGSSASVARHTTDVGNAQRFAAQHGTNVRYCYAWKSWLVWDGMRWKVDDSGEIERKAKQSARAILTEAANIDNKHEREDVARWALTSEKRERLNAMIALAQSEQPIPIAVECLDAEPWLLNCENGTLDLRTGELRSHEREDFLTKICPLEYPTEAGVDPVLWLEFLDTIFDGNAELIGFMQRLLGMSLVGEVFEHLLPIFHGSGSNGKSVLQQAWGGVLGPDYAMAAPDGFLVATKSDKHPTEVADLFGKRFVYVNETADGGRLSESLVKRLSSSERIRARWLHKDFFEFPPSHTITLSTNHKPIIRGTDAGIWRRLRLVPFAVTIPDDKQDKDLTNKLKAEYPAILRWAVLGCLEWQQNGKDLKAPEEVIAATQEYRAEQDILGGFIEEYCNVGEKEKYQARSANLYAAWHAYCESRGEKFITNETQFGLLLSNDKRFHKDRPSSGPNRNKTMYYGISLDNYACEALFKGTAGGASDDGVGF